MVFHDDLDLATGDTNKLGSGPQIHNGVNGIRQQLQTSEFWYARIGVDSRQGPPPTWSRLRFAEIAGRREANGSPRG